MDRVEVKVVAESGAKLPQYMTEGSAGMDVYAFLKESVKIDSLERVLIPTGIKMEIPYGYEIQVRPRSGLAAKHGISIVNSPGTTDAVYRGEIKIILVNLSDQEFVLNPGERIAQMVVAKYERVEWVETDQLADSERGEGGFGSTGKH